MSFATKYWALLQVFKVTGEVEFFGELQPLADARAFQRYLDAATKREWVVYAKRPFNDATCVLKYLAGYTHRVAISNSRILSYRDGKVTFRYKDYAPREPTTNDDRSGHRVYSPLPVARSARRLHANSALRVLGQSSSTRETGNLPSLAGLYGHR